MPQTVQADIGRLLAVEPDASQAEALRQFVREGMKGADLVIVSSAYAAVVAINRQLPDVVLFSESIGDKHRDRVLDHLRSTIKPAIPQRLTLPSLRHCDRAALAGQITKLIAKAQELRPRSGAPSPAAPAPAAPAPRPVPAAPPAPAAQRPVADIDLKSFAVDNAPSLLAPADGSAMSILGDSAASGADAPTMLDGTSLQELESLVEDFNVDALDSGSGASSHRELEESTDESDEHEELELSIEDLAQPLTSDDSAGDAVDAEVHAAEIALVQAMADAKLAEELERVRTEAAEQR